ncbi:MAG: pimeloyl-CoA dehydrogenase small subunit [Gammaproteobacteria bacterium]|nr:pimeloyl-CoA dehydrogenase small subunit [Gammaproteobacteria bacterium]
MDFELTPDQQMITDGLQRLLAERYDFEHRKVHLFGAPGWSRDMWSRYAEMGLLGLPFAQSDGGLGCGPVETMIVSEAFGRALALEPYIPTVLLAGGCLRLAGTPAQRSDLVPRIAEGSELLAFAHVERQARYDLADVTTTAQRPTASADWTLNGAKSFVLHADTADKLIVSARVSGRQRDRSGLALFLVDSNAPGVARRAYVMQDGMRAADVTLSNVRVSSDALLGTAGNALPIIERVVDCTIAALCAEAVGAMTRAHELTVEYLKVRKQFGAPIGSFQALQHRAVDMLVMIEQARSLSMYATMMAEEADAKTRAQAISAAKSYVGRAGKLVGEQAIQLHGGIGVTEECAVGHYYRRLTMIDILLGDSAHHLAVVAASAD